MRELSLAAKRAIFAQETDEVFVVLITITHDHLVDPIRVCDDSADIVSRGETYIAYPFYIDLPDEPHRGQPKATLQIDNVSQDIVIALRELSSPPVLTMEVVLASSPDTVEASFPDFDLQSVTYDALTITGELGQESFLTEPYPADTFVPSTFPGLF